MDKKGETSRGHEINTDEMRYMQRWDLEQHLVYSPPADTHNIMCWGVGVWQTAFDQAHMTLTHCLQPPQRTHTHAHRASGPKAATLQRLSHPTQHDILTVTNKCCSSPRQRVPEPSPLTSAAHSPKQQRGELLYSDSHGILRFCLLQLVVLVWRDMLW